MRKQYAGARAFMVLALIAAGLMVGTTGAQATHQPLSHVKGTYPNVGWHWLDNFNDGLLFVDSDRCKSYETTAWSYINNQLKEGASEFRGAWPYGIDLFRNECNGAIDNFTDILLDYMTSSEWTAAGHGSYGGHHHGSLATSSYCSYWGLPHPCGYHISRLHLNEPRVDGYSSSYKSKFFAHETSHSMGFNDYCGHTSVANNGASCSLNGVWASVDKKMLRDVVYKNSPVHY